MADLSVPGAEGEPIVEIPYPRLRTFIPKQQRDFGRITQYHHLDPVYIVARTCNPERQDQFIEKIFTDAGTQEGAICSTNSVS